MNWFTLALISAILSGVAVVFNKKTLNIAKEIESTIAAVIFVFAGFFCGVAYVAVSGQIWPEQNPRPT